MHAGAGGPVGVGGLFEAVEVQQVSGLEEFSVWAWQSWEFHRQKVERQLKF